MSKQRASFLRLRKLYAMLQGVPNNRVDLQNWRGHDHKIHKCGTVACAVGWATLYPPFKRAGFRDQDGAPILIGEGGIYSYSGWDAVREFFGLTKDEALSIFQSNMAATRTDDFRIIKAIRGADTSEVGMTHRQIVLRRILRFLVWQGTINIHRAQELAHQENVLLGRVEPA